MNRSAPTRRTGLSKGPHHPKRPRHPLLVPKRLGESARDYKVIARDQDHMARVAALGCLICGRPAQFHHVDVCTPKNMGAKVSDYIGAPLCPDHHTDDKHESAHGYGGERAFWERHGIDIGRWIADLLRRSYPEPNEHVAAALAAIEKQRTIQGPD